MLELHINWTKQYIFCAWFLFFNIMFIRYIYIIACFIKLLLLLSNYSLVQRSVIFFCEKTYSNYLRFSWLHTDLYDVIILLKFFILRKNIKIIWALRMHKHNQASGQICPIDCTLPILL